MKRQDFQDALIKIAQDINDQAANEVRRELERLVDHLATEDLEGKARESGLKVTLAKGQARESGLKWKLSKDEYVVPPDSLSETIVPPWMKGGQIGIQPAFPEGPRMEFPISGNDREIDIASVCVRALDSLPPEDRQRIARYLADRFEVS